MKRTILLLLSLCLLLSLVACGNPETDASDSAGGSLSQVENLPESSDLSAIGNGSQPPSKVDLTSYPFRMSYEAETLVVGWNSQGFRSVTLTALIEHLGEDVYISEQPFMEFGVSADLFYNADGSAEFREDSVVGFELMAVPDVVPTVTRVGVGATESRRRSIIFDANAPGGTYHLRLSFLDHAVIFENAVLIPAPNKPVPGDGWKVSWVGETKGEKDGDFTFGYQAIPSVCKGGGTITAMATMGYSGKEAYPYVGDASSMVPVMKFYYNKDGGVDPQEDSYVLSVTHGSAVHSDVGITPLSKHSERGTLSVPEDAPVGRYHLIVFFDGYYRIFTDALEVQ